MTGEGVDDLVDVLHEEVERVRRADPATGRFR